MQSLKLVLASLVTFYPFSFDCLDKSSKDNEFLSLFLPLFCPFTRETYEQGKRDYTFSTVFVLAIWLVTNSKYYFVRFSRQMT
jgi:hypothetical protein